MCKVRKVKPAIYEIPANMNNNFYQQKQSVTVFKG